jgi:hypothetical protein
MFENIDIEKSLKNAQTSLLIMILLTIFNVIGMFFATGLYVPYSAILPSVFAFFAIEYQLVVFVFLILLVIGFYVGAAYIAQKKPIWYGGAFALYVIDSIVMILWFFYFTEFSMMTMLDVIFHGWILLSLFKGTLAAYKNMVA